MAGQAEIWLLFNQRLAWFGLKKICSHRSHRLSSLRKDASLPLILNTSCPPSFMDTAILWVAYFIGNSKWEICTYFLVLSSKVELQHPTKQKISLFVGCRPRFTDHQIVFTQTRPGAVIGFTENYTRRVAAYCAAPASRLWLWRITGCGQRTKPLPR